MEEEKRKSVVLIEARMGLSEHKERKFTVDAAEGTTLKDVMEPGYWAYVAKDFKRLVTEVRVVMETGEWMADFLVTACDTNWAKVHLLHLYELTPPTEEDEVAAKYIVKWKGTHNKYSVIRQSDQAPIQDRFETKDEARAWLKNYEAASGR